MDFSLVSCAFAFAPAVLGGVLLLDDVWPCDRVLRLIQQLLHRGAAANSAFAGSVSVLCLPFF